MAPPWRYVQFDYSVRLLNDGFFGQDVIIPGVTVTYNLQTAAEGTQGRDQTYMLPALADADSVARAEKRVRYPGRVGQTFASIASRRFRSSLARILAWVSFAFAGVLAVFAWCAPGRFARKPGAVAVRKLLCLPCSADAWTRSATSPRTPRGPDGREAGTACWGRDATSPVPWRSIARWLRTSWGRTPSSARAQVTVRKGWIRPRRVLLSASVTSKVIAGHLGNGHQLRASTRARLESISEALGVFSAASYGRNGNADAIALDAAIESSKDAIRGLRSRARWPMRTASALVRSFTGF